MTEDITLMLEAAFDVPVDSLMQMQTKYNMQTARQEKIIAKLNQIKKIAAVFKCIACNKRHFSVYNHKKMKKRFVIKNFFCMFATLVLAVHLYEQELKDLR